MMEHSYNNAPSRTTVQLPNLVVSFLADVPAINENYYAASKASREWVTRRCGLKERGQRMLLEGDFAYFCALNTPDCEMEGFRDFCDWTQWIFPFDDFFDDGVLRDDFEGAKAMLDNLVDCLLELATPETMFRGAHQDIFHRFQEKASEGNRRRFIQAIIDYATHVLRQVENCSFEEVQEPKELLELRRNSIGVKPLYAFVEYCDSIDLPDEIFDHPLIKEIETLGIDWVLIQNDLISYPKDEKDGVNHNLISACRIHGMTAQEAYDHLGAMLEEIYERFDKAINELPSWSEEVDSQVKRYIEGIKNCVKANLHWSFRTDRYFGTQKLEVQKTGKFKVLKKPPYLEGR